MEAMGTASQSTFTSTVVAEAAQNKQVQLWAKHGKCNLGMNDCFSPTEQDNRKALCGIHHPMNTVAAGVNTVPIDTQ